MRFDLIGSRETGAVAILHLKEREDPASAAREIMRRHKLVRSVLLKAGPRKGPHRLRQLILISGSRSTEVVHKEHGYRLRLDPLGVYFSPREATDRAHIAEKVEPGERVLVMFAGVGPYAIAIASAQPDVEEVIGIEMSEDAYEYFVGNVALNRLEGKVKPILGDVVDVCPSLFGEFDRAVMPLPMGAHEFLELGLKCLKPRGGILHYYAWGGEEAHERTARRVRDRADMIGLRAVIIGWRRVSAYSPRKWKIGVDFLVSPSEQIAF